MESSLKISFFLPAKETLVATVNETLAATSKIYAAKQDIMMPNLLRTIQFFWLHSSVFAFERYPKTLNFQSIFVSKRTIRGYFQ